MGGSSSSLLIRYVLPDDGDIFISWDAVDALQCDKDCDVYIVYREKPLKVLLPEMNDVDALVSKWKDLYSEIVAVREDIFVRVDRIRSVARKDDMTILHMSCGQVMRLSLTEKEHTDFAQKWLEHLNFRQVQKSVRWFFWGR